MLPSAKCFVLYSMAMERTLKTLLLWLLIALVPLHAGAAAMGMSCSPVHQQTMSATSEHHEYQGNMAHQHDSDSATAAVAESPSLPDAHHAADGSGHSTCSACSDFCIGAVAPPSTLSSLPAFNGTESAVISRPPSVVGFVPDGLKRPPRKVSA